MYPLYKYYFKTPTGWLTVVDNVVTEVMDETPIIHSPEEWEDTEIGWKRDMKLGGVFSTFTGDYSMALDAKAICSYLWQTYGYEAGVDGSVLFVIKMRQINPNDYSTIYSGELDFSKLTNSRDTLKLPIIEGGITSKFHANRNIPYEVPFDGDAFGVLMEGQELKNAADFTFGNNLTGTDNTNENNVPSITLYSSVLATPLVRGVNYKDTGDLNFRNFSFFKANIQTTITITYDLGLSIEILGGIDYTATTVKSGFFVKDSGYVTTQIFDLIDESNVTVWHNTNYHLTGTLTITMDAGDELYYRSGTTGAPNNVIWHYNTEQDSVTPIAPGLVHLDFSFIYDNSTALHFHYSDYLKKLADLALEGTGTSTSNFLAETTADIDSYPAYLGVTCGNALRNTTTITPAIYAALDDLIGDIMNRFGVCVGIISDKLRVERYSYFFDTTTTHADLGVVDKFEEAPAIDLLGNQLKDGYKNYDGDILNSQYEFNTLWQRKFPVKRISTEINNVCAFRSDALGEEITRANFSGIETKDNKSDNDVFVNELDKDDNTALAKPAFSITGVFSPTTVYNVTQSPKRNELRKGAWYSSILWLLGDGYISYQQTDKNQSLESKLYSGSDTINEKADVLVSDLPEPFFIPVYQSFTSPATAELLSLMNTPLTGKFIFTANGQQREGFLAEATFNPRLKEIKWKLLATADSYIG